jgi:hypothetical protein
MILRNRFGREGLPLVGAFGRDDDPPAEGLAATARVEQVRSRDGERASVHRGIGELLAGGRRCRPGGQMRVLSGMRGGRGLVGEP